MSNAISTVVYDAFRCFYYQFFIADNIFVVGATLVVALIMVVTLIMVVALIRNWDCGVVWAYCMRPISANTVRYKWANAIRPYRRKMRFVAIVPFVATVPFGAIVPIGAIVSFRATTRVAPTGGIYGVLRPNNRIMK